MQPGMHVRGSYACYSTDMCSGLRKTPQSNSTSPASESLRVKEETDGAYGWPLAYLDQVCLYLLSDFTGGTDASWGCGPVWKPEVV